MTRRVEDINSTSPCEESRSDENFGMESMRPLFGLNVFSVPNTNLELKTLPEHLEYVFLEEGEQKVESSGAETNLYGNSTSKKDGDISKGDM